MLNPSRPPLKKSISPLAFTTLAAFALALAAPVAPRLQGAEKTKPQPKANTELTEEVANAQHFNWMPPEASSEGLRGEEGGELILPEIVITQTPKATGDLSKFTKEYLIDLKKFNISNDGTHPVETSKGINEALKDAQAVGANRVVFPKGTYLISESDPVILDQKNTVIDLNGATLQINTNGLQKYTVVGIADGAENLRITNGTIKGDKQTHDYKTVKGTHEWGTALGFIGGHNIEADHLELTDATGDGATSGATGNRTRPELLAMIFYTVSKQSLESGALSEQGQKVDSAEKLRSVKPFDISKCGGQFEFGYTGGVMGYPYIKGRVYQAYFYDATMAFLEKKKCLQFKKVTIPAGAKFMHLEFNQPEIIAKDTSNLGRITNFRPSTDVYFHDNHLIGNRRLGMAFCGGQKWVIENNLFEANGGTNPACGVDFEDGWELMQDVVFRNNKFKANRAGDLVVCAGTELIFEGNDFEKSVITWGRPHHYIFRNNHFNGGHVGFTTRTGIADIHGNHYENCTLSIRFDTKAVADGLYRKPGATVSTPALKLENETLANVSKITGTYFNFTNCKLENAHFIAGKETCVINLIGCKAEGTSIEYEAEGPAVAVSIKGGTGTIEQEGPGVARRKLQP